MLYTYLLYVVGTLVCLGLGLSVMMCVALFRDAH